jgi:hypothetical protein
MVDIAFIDATLKFREGDPRALAEFVRTHDLTPEQREFVASALAGDVAILDGHKHQPQTEYMVWLYDTNKRHLGYPDAVIYRALDEKFGLADDSSRRTISRAIKRRKG